MSGTNPELGRLDGGQVGPGGGASRHVPADDRRDRPDLGSTPTGRFPAYVGLTLESGTSPEWPSPNLWGSVGLALRQGAASWFGWLQYRPEGPVPRYATSALSLAVAIACHAPGVRRTFVGAADLTVQAPGPGADPNEPPYDVRWDASTAQGSLDDYGALFPPRGSVDSRALMSTDAKAADLLRTLLAGFGDPGELVWVSASPELTHRL